MTTLADITAKIGRDITRTDLSSTIIEAVNEAILLWEAERFAFNEKRYLINTVASQEYYDLAAPTLLTSAGAAVATGESIIEIDSITNTVNNMPYPLTPRTQQWFDMYQSLPAIYRGQPDSYGIYGNQLRLFPCPDAAYPVNISAHARLGPNPLVNNTDTNDWLVEGEPLIRGQAKVIVFGFPLKDDAGVAGAQRSTDAAFVALKRKMSAKAFTGQMAAWRG